MGPSQFLRRTGRLLTAVIQYGCVAHCFLEFVGDFIVCFGHSMEPTIYSGDVILTEHLSPAKQAFCRGDIVIVRSPVNPRQYICKRVIALPGDKVDNKKWVPKGHLWLGGDNRTNSMDSWTYGAVPQALVRGRVVCKVWPLNNIQMLSDRWLPANRID